MDVPYNAQTARLLERWPILHIFKAARQALQASKLGVAATGLLATLLAGTVLDFVWTSAGGGLTITELRDDSPPLILPERYYELPIDERVGLFAALREHTSHCISESLTAARKLHFTGGTTSLRDALNRGDPAVGAPSAADGYGVLPFFAALLNGWVWTARHHYVFTLLLGVALLAIWSVAGGSICRISTLRFARDEYLSAREALTFAGERFWAFFLGPAVLLIIILVMGLMISLAALVLNGIASIGWLSWLGWGLIGVLFFLALLAGVTIALIAFDLLGGFPLMWPTVAAEGSDFTDAISRSGYFYQAIERAIGYALCAVVYGAIACTVVRGIAYLALWTTHGFIELGLPEINDLWVTPTLDTFFATPASDPPSNLAWFMIRSWVGLFSVVVGAYLVSYFFTASTIAYHLLRLAVDETELDDIYTDGGPTENDDEAVLEPPPAPAQVEQGGVGEPAPRPT